MREQTQPVHRAVGVDTSSGDRSGAILTELLGPAAVFGMEPDTGYGAAISRALQHPAARAPVPAAGTDQETPVEWIWLLHDDCEPAPDALEQLLRAASRSKTTAVLGPKLRDLADRRVLREAGITVDRAGRRVTGIEPGEIDQGQHDGNRAAVAVSSAGMLVRRDVWDQLGGFDANLPLGRDDVDFCWRAHAAGYDVRVATDAVVYHRELSARQIRKAPAAGGRPRLLDRRGALYVFAVNVPFGPMLVMMGGCVAGTLVRAAYFLITKQQRKAWDQLGALAWLARHPLLVWRARRNRAATLRHGYAVLRDQLPKGRTLAKLAESAASLLSRGPAYEGSGLHSASTEGRGRPAAAQREFGHQARLHQPRRAAVGRPRGGRARRRALAGRPGARRFRHAQRRRARARLGRRGRAMARVPGGLPRHRGRVGRQRAVLSCRGRRAGRRARGQDLARHRRAAARLRARCRGDGVPGRPPGHRHGSGQGVDRGHLRAAAGGHGRGGGRPHRHRGRLRPASAHRNRLRADPRRTIVSQGVPLHHAQGGLGGRPADRGRCGVRATDLGDRGGRGAGGTGCLALGSPRRPR